MNEGCALFIFILILFFVIIPNIWTLVGIALFLVLLKMLAQ